MVGRFRRWRPLMAVVAIWALVFWYFFADTDDYRIPTTSFTNGEDGQPIQKGQNGKAPVVEYGKDGRPTRWQKLPERYPVKDLKSLPTGAPIDIPRIQTKAREESADALKERQRRQRAVKAIMKHGWGQYRKNAWKADEIMPLTGKPKVTFGGWGATLVDALDTLWILGMKDEFVEAVKACEKLDFTKTDTVSINVFETTIRYLGGFLGAYELSDKKYPALLRKSVEVADLLMCAFDTPNRMPISRWDWATYMKGTKQKAPKSVLISEIGTLSLEFTKLSQLTGDMRYYDAIQRIYDELEKIQMVTALPGMWPISVDASSLAYTNDVQFTLGGMSDSAYEYLPKQHLLLGGLSEQPKRMYENFVATAREHLFRRALNEHDTPLVISGDAYVTQRGKGSAMKVTYTPRGQHLTCFVPGMLAVGGKVFDRKADVELAAEMADACVWSYNVTASGIGAEIFTFVPCGGVDDEQTGEKCKYSEKKWRDAISERWLPAVQVVMNDGSEEQKQDDLEEQISRVISKQRLSPGITEYGDRKYILRPEAIESVFIMYRVTGDPAWMDKAWNMFEHVEKHTSSKFGAASLTDVTRSDPTQVDSMESFWFAETLKYYYLVFADFDEVSLDEWVLNTEAHPLRRPRAGSELKNGA